MSHTLYVRLCVCKITSVPRFFLVFSVVFIALGCTLSFAGQRVDKTIVQALQSAAQGRWDISYRLIKNVGDPLAQKLYTWMYFTDGSSPSAAKNSGYKNMIAFVKANPTWPSQKKMRLEIEKAMPETMNKQDAISWFDLHDPLTAKGFFIYTDALISQKKTVKAKEQVKQWWTEKPLSREHQKELYSKYGGYIDMSAHQKRLNNLIDERYYTNAKAVAGVLGRGYPELTRARIALAQNKKNVNTLINAVPSHLRNDPGLLYARLKWRRKKNLNEGALEILNRAPGMQNVSNSKAWWTERHILIRRYLEQKNYARAYALASRHKQINGFPFAQAEWLSGWISLSFLNKPQRAFNHFEKLYNNVKTPISKARASYWAGRAATGMRNTQAAEEWYSRAAQYQTTFYGQTAGAQIGKQKALNFAAPPKISPQEQAQFEKNDLIRAAKLLHQAGFKKESGYFLQVFIAAEESPRAHMFAINTAIEIKDFHSAVKIAKTTANKGLFFTTHAYPLILGQIKNTSVDLALVHALIRQESQFDVRAKSPAGALGLMQLMPATARETAQKLGVRHQNAYLTTMPSHNIMLGSAYLKQMLARYNGAYPMAIAAYNAGPGRVDKWIKKFGDPRLGRVDWIDWMESIPIYETRNYVQRVLEGTYVYHLRLKQKSKKTREPLHIVQVY